MPKFETTRRVPFSAAQMYAVVADVERYPEFLPLCEGAVGRERGGGGARTRVTGCWGGGYRGRREACGGRRIRGAGANESGVAEVDGACTDLDNRWRFRDTTSGSEIHFYIDYAFASRMLAMVMGAVFDKAVRKYTDAFEARARQIYGAPSSSATA